MKMSLFRKMAAASVAVVLAVASFTGCGSGKQEAEQQTTPETSTVAYEKQNIEVAALKGPTAIGMVQIMDNAKKGEAGNNYNFHIEAAADAFTADLIKGDIQIAALPCNAAATLYNKSNGKIQILGINTLGVLSILDTGDSVQSVADLKGKTIYATGKGTTPEYTLRYLLKSAGIDPDTDVTIEFKSEGAEVAAVLAQSETEAVAMLPQPYVTTVLMQNQKARIALDVTREWEKLAGKDSTVVTGVVVVNTEYYKNHKDAVDVFAKEYAQSVSYVNANVDAAAELVESFDIFKAAVAKKAIPNCNITFIQGSEMKTKVNNYLKVLFDANPNAVGGSLPDDAFYIN